MNNRIVIADDEPDVLNLLTVLFQSKGYDVLAASDGEEALHLIQTGEPIAAILDFMMPKLDGISVCEQVRQTNKRLFIVITSGIGSAKLKTYSKTAQANEYIEKPIRMANLVEKIKVGIANTK